MAIALSSNKITNISNEEEKYSVINIIILKNSVSKSLNQYIKQM